MEYHLDAAKYPDGIQILEVKPGVGFVYLDSDRGSMRIMLPAEEIAEAVVKDYVGTVLGSRGDVHPGLFSLIGNFTIPEILKEELPRLTQARQKQDAWFKNLVVIADDDWSKYHQHKMISNVQRLAARCLGYQRDWLNAIPDQDQLCPACRSIIDPRALVCSVCKTIVKPDEYKKSGLVQVGA
jgi:hypothetical protein